MPAVAEQAFNLSGFGTFGMTYSDSDIYGFRTEASQKEGIFDGDVSFARASILGLQADFKLSSELDLVYQAVYRDQTDLDLNNITDLAFLRYTPHSAWTVRVGRTAYDIYFISEYRDVGFAYPWAHVPLETYGAVPYRYLDGIDVSYTKQFDQFTLSTKFFTGQNEIKFFGYIERSTHQTVKLDDIYGLSLDFQSPKWVLKLKHTTVKIDNNAGDLVDLLSSLPLIAPGFSAIWPNAIEFSQRLSLANKAANYSSVSGRYDFNRWSIIGEFSKISSDSLALPPIKSGYLSTVYYRGRHSFFGIYAASRRKLFDLSSQNINRQALSLAPDGDLLYIGVDSILKASGADQNTVSLGWRWDFNDRIAWTLQWDRIDVQEGGSSVLLKSTNVTDLSDSFNVGIVNVSFTF